MKSLLSILEKNEMRIWIINLKRSKDRRDRIQKNG